MLASKKYILISLVILLSLAVFGVGSVLAQSNDSQTSSSPQDKQGLNQELEQRRQQIEQENKQKLDELKQQAKIKQDQKVATLCQKVRAKIITKHEHIKEITEAIAQRTNLRVERAKGFVAKKELKVENYDSLLKDVEANRQVVINARSEIVSATAAFDCHSSNRKEQEANVKAKVKSYMSAIELYRQSVRNLLLAVKSAAKAQLPSSSVNQSASEVAR